MKRRRGINGPKLELKDWLKPQHYPPRIDYTHPLMQAFLEEFKKKRFYYTPKFAEALEKNNLPYPEYPKSCGGSTLWEFSTRLELDGVVIRQLGLDELPRYDGKLIRQKLPGYALNMRWYKEFKKV